MLVSIGLEQETYQYGSVGAQLLVTDCIHAELLVLSLGFLHAYMQVCAT